MQRTYDSEILAALTLIRPFYSNELWVQRIDIQITISNEVHALFLMDWQAPQGLWFGLPALALFCFFICWATSAFSPVQASCNDASSGSNKWAVNEMELWCRLCAGGSALTNKSRQVVDSRWRSRYPRGSFCFRKNSKQICLVVRILGVREPWWTVKKGDSISPYLNYCRKCLSRSSTCVRVVCQPATNTHGKQTPSSYISWRRQAERRVFVAYRWYSLN